MTHASEIELAELLERLHDPRLLILDVRTEAEFAGAGGYPCDPRQGHVPGARHLPFEEVVERSPDDLVGLVGPAGEGEIVAYCHSGSRSGLAVAWLRRAGYPARNYAGSWHEWSRDPSLPAEAGQ